VTSTPRRVSVVGNSGSGKTRLARQLAAQLGVPYIEIDQLNHQPGWQERSVEELREALRPLLEGDGWVVDGNYRNRVGDLVRGGADTVLWLDYPRRVVLSRVIRRTVRRVLTREELWNGNREPLSNLWSRDPQRSIIAWSWTQHDSYRRQYEVEMADPGNAHLRYVRLRTPAEGRRWLVDLSPPAGSP
jgi:adenylate kinase family enzyme